MVREMSVAGLALSTPDESPVLLLREVSGDRFLPVWIGLEAAQAIAHVTEHHDRPLTHTLIVDVIESLGHVLREVLITEVRDDVFLAELVLDEDIHVSARPSDAIALALLTGVSIRAEDGVLDRGAVPAAALGIEEPAGRGEEAAETQIERFRAFLDRARPEDFDPGPGNGPDER